jgi:hypothetical protein
VILFLDIDGVLHHETADGPDRFSGLPHLHAILRASPDLDVVFSSDWRRSASLDELIRLVTPGAPELASRFVGVTPVLAPGLFQHRREAECRAWLREQGMDGAPWLAIDDAEHGFEGPGLYLVDHRTGLTADDVTAILQRVHLQTKSTQI